MEYTLAPLGMTISLDIGKALVRYAVFCLATVAAETRGSVAIPAPLSLRESEKTAFMSSPVLSMPSSLASEEQSSRPVGWQMPGRENPGLCSLRFPI